jgi:hypothetical protein
MGQKPDSGPIGGFGLRDPRPHAHQVLDAMLSASPRRRCTTPIPSPCRRWSLAHQKTGLQPARRPRAPRSILWPPWSARIAAVHDTSARRRAERLSFGLTGAPRWGARATYALTLGLPRTSAWSGTLVARCAAPRRRGGSHDPCTQGRSPSASSQGNRTVTANTRTWKVQVLRVAAGVLKHTRLTCDLVQSVPWCVATAVLAHARPRRARSVQPSGSQRRSSKRGGDTPIIPCTRKHGTSAGPKHLPRTATATPKSTNGSGAPSVAVRQSCGSMASIQACSNGRRVSTSPIHHRKETKGEERVDWPGGAHGGAAV